MSRLLQTLLLSIMLGACVTTSHDHGVDIYDNVDGTQEYTYGIQANAPKQLSKHLDIAVTYWNEALGRDLLRVSNDYDKATVKIKYKEVQTTKADASHTLLLGCMDVFSTFFDCEIQLNIPNSKTILGSMNQYAHIFKKGPLDTLLFTNMDYSDDSNQYLQDKITLISLIHEIGHTLGLGHTEGEQCIMASAPLGSASFCNRVLEAARTKLQIAQMIKKP